jgi:hypothetical protein
MKFAIIIPTLPRKNGFQYLERTLAENKWFLENHNTFIYCDAEHYNPEWGFPHLERIAQTAEQNPHVPGTHEFWTTSLTRDFQYSVSRADREACDYVLWLEDDSILIESIDKFVPTKDLVAIGPGNTGVFVKSSYVDQFIRDVDNCDPLNTPCDWLVDKLGIDRSHEYIRHIGAQSSSGAIRAAKK